MSISKSDLGTSENEVNVRSKRKDEKKEKKEEQKKISKQGNEQEESNTVKEEEKEIRSKKRPRKDQAETERVRKDKRKSVSFADVDVDVDDNDNIDAKDTTQPDTDDEIIDEEHLRKKRKQEKRAKREQRRKKDSSFTTTTTTSSTDSSTSPIAKPGTETPFSSSNPILTYLSQYHNDRAGWKFQKIRETHLLKNVFSLDRIPAEYNLALLAYLKGLKNEGARTRLRRAAQDYIKVDEGVAPKENNNNNNNNTIEEQAEMPVGGPLPESWKERYADAVHRFKGNLNAGVKDLNEGVSLAAASEDEGEDVTNILARFENRKRVELVLWTVSGKISKSTANTGSSTSKLSTEMDITSTTTARGNNKQKAPARKKRKNRTMVVEISSSSESSDSDSE